MGFLAWHKLASRVPVSSFPTGCTFACCCSKIFSLVVCGEEGITPGGCQNVFQSCCYPYPISFEDSICCFGRLDQAWCPPPTSEGYIPGICYESDREYVKLCVPWTGEIQENGSIIWFGGDVANLNCPTNGYSCQGTEFTGPLTARISTGLDYLGTTGAFQYGRENRPGYQFVEYCDPAFAWQTPPRYYRTPIQNTSEPTYIYESPHCLRIKTNGIHVRTLILSGYNKYNYTGYLTADPQVAVQNYTIPTIVDNPGASGLSQMEGSLGRPFPLSDDVMTFPIWGSATGYADNSVVGDCTPCWSGFREILEDQGISGYCAGDGCLRTQTNSTTGHYLAMQSNNVTGHYFSFAGFNPYVKFWKSSDALGSPSLTSGTGLPPCSLYSLAWSLYDASWRAIAQYSSNSTESALLTAYPSEFGAVRSKLNSLLSDDPRNLTGSHGESVVTYWFDQLNDALTTFINTATSTESLFLINNDTNSLLGEFYEYGAFTTPKVILWDKAAFESASTNDVRWKSLYIPGSGNIVFDSGCTNTGSAWKAYKVVLDEATHDMAWGSTHAARMVQFRVCDASTSQITSQTCISLSMFMQDDDSLFCSYCADASAPFNMGENDCITGPRPEIWGDDTVGTDYGAW